MNQFHRCLKLPGRVKPSFSFPHIERSEQVNRNSILPFHDGSVRLLDRLVRGDFNCARESSFAYGRIRRTHYVEHILQSVTSNGLTDKRKCVYLVETITDSRFNYVLRLGVDFHSNLLRGE